MSIEQMQLRRQCCAGIIYVSSFHTHLAFSRNMLLDISGFGCKGRAGRRLKQVERDSNN
jgi:hypothetical protein